MNHYINYKLHVSDAQKKKLKRALSSEATETVSLKFSPEDMDGGDDILALTKTQINKLRNAFDSGKGAIIKMSSTQLEYNMKVEGGFLPLLAAAIPALIAAAKFAIPAIATGALTGAASYGVQKAIGKGLYLKKGGCVGNGLYLKKGGCICRVETDGKGLYLEPVSGKGLKVTGDGLFLKNGSGVYDGSELLSGPFKDIPVLKSLL